MSIDIYHPEVPVDKPMSKAMKETLIRIVNTNGGGIYGLELRHSTLKDLADRHLVQGKKGQPFMAVHTKLGLLKANELKAIALAGVNTKEREDGQR